MAQRELPSTYLQLQSATGRYRLSPVKLLRRMKCRLALELAHPDVSPLSLATQVLLIKSRYSGLRGFANPEITYLRDKFLLIRRQSTTCHDPRLTSPAIAF